MKDKLDWFDDNWNWDVRPTRVLYELLLSYLSDFHEGKGGVFL